MTPYPFCGWIIQVCTLITLYFIQLVWVSFFNCNIYLHYLERLYARQPFWRLLKSPLTFRKNPIRIISFELFLSSILFLPYLNEYAPTLLSPTAVNLAKVSGWARTRINVGVFRERCPWTPYRLLALSIVAQKLPAIQSTLPKKSWWRFEALGQEKG